MTRGSKTRRPVFTGTPLETVIAAIMTDRGDPSLEQIQEAIAQLESDACELARLRLQVKS